MTDPSGGRHGLASSPRAVIRQLVATGSGEVVNRMAQLGSVSLVGWVLGVDGLAQVGLAWSLTAAALSVVQAGPEMAGMVALTTPASAGLLTAQTVRVKAAFAAMAAPILLAVQVALGHGDMTGMFQLGAQILAMTAAAQSHVWVLRNLGRAFDQGVARLVQAVAGVALLALLLVLWRSPLAYPLAECAASLAGVAVARRRLGPLLSLPPKAPLFSRELTLASLKMGGLCMVSNIMWLTPVVAASRWTPLEDVSYLTGIMRLLIGMNSILHLCLHALYPYYAQLAGRRADDGARAMAALALQAGAATLLAAGGCALSAEWLIPVLLGPELAPAAPVFAALVPALVPTAIGAPLIYALMARKQAAALNAIHGVVTTAMIVGCAWAFHAEPTAWGALVIHAVMWLHLMLTGVVAWRLGCIRWPGREVARMLNPAYVLRLLGNRP